MTEATTPLMRQYQSIKKRYPHALVLFRLGDFYELFYEDAIVAARELQITLTSRNREKGEPIPMCGVPHHAAEGYIARLLRSGYKIAVCDQLEQPGPGKKLVRRDVVRVITPGTATDMQVLEPKENNFSGGRSARRSDWVTDWTCVRGCHHRRISRHGIRGSAGRRAIARRTANSTAARDSGATAGGSIRPGRIGRYRRSCWGRAMRRHRKTRLDEWIFRSGYGERILAEQFGVHGLEGLGLAGHAQAICAAGALLHYLRETSAKTAEPSPAALSHLEPVRYYEQQDALALDPVTVRNLEIVAPLFAEEGARGSVTGGPTSLLAALDETATNMGARLLRAWILRPEVDRDEIAARLDAVAELKSRTVLRGEIRQDLGAVLDLERLARAARPWAWLRRAIWQRCVNRWRVFRCCAGFSNKRRALV